MCGIAGEFGFDNAPPEAAAMARMLAKLARRGPDAEGQHADGAVRLGHRRLAIIENRNMILSRLAAIYPGSIAGDSLFRVMVGLFPDYTRSIMVKDLYYLEEKRYVQRRAKGSRHDATESWRDASWALTAAGNEVANRLVEDPALEV